MHSKGIVTGLIALFGTILGFAYQPLVGDACCWITNGNWQKTAQLPPIHSYMTSVHTKSPKGDNEDNECKRWEFLHSWDDSHNFVQNTYFSEPNFANVVSRVFQESIVNVYEPVSWLVKLIFFKSIGSVDPLAIRLLSCVFHLMTCIGLTFLTVELITFSNNIGGSNQRVSRHCNFDTVLLWSIASVSLFAVHPVNVEVIGWPSAQSYTMSSTFGVASVLASWKRYDYLAILLYICATLSKSAVLPLPFVIACLEVYRFLLSTSPSGNCEDVKLCSGTLRGLLDRFIECKGIFWTITILILGWITILSNTQGMDAHADVIELSGYQRVLKSMISLTQCFTTFLWPVELRPHYRVKVDELTLHASVTLVSCCYLLLGITYCVQRVHSSVNTSLVAASIIVMSLPTSGLVQHGMVSITADRYMYFPFMILVPVLANYSFQHCFTISMRYPGYRMFPRKCTNQLNHSTKVQTMEQVTTDQFAVKTKKQLGTDQFGVKATNKVVKQKQVSSAQITVRTLHDTENHMNRSIGMYAFMIAWVVLFCTWILLSRKQIQIWRNDATLHQYGLVVDPVDWRIADIYGELLLKYDHVDEANEYWKTALQFSPSAHHGDKAKLHQAKLLVVLGDLNAACDIYASYFDGKQLARGASSSVAPLIMNNFAICNLRPSVRAHREESLSLMYEASSLAAKMQLTSERQESLRENIRVLKAWNGASGYNGKLMW